MLKRVLNDVLTKGVGSHGSSKGKLSSMLMLTSTIHSSQPHSAPRSFFGVEDYMDDNNSRPYTYQKEKKSKNPQKHISFKQRTIAFMEPFTLDVFISKRFVQASITHRVTCKQVAVAGTNSKDIKAALPSRCDIPACLAVGRFLADRAREADVYTASYTPRDRDKFEGKIRAVVQSLIDNDLKGGQQAARGENMGTTSGGGGLNDAVDFFYKARGFAPLYTQLQLSLSAKNLRDMDIMSKSYPMAVVYLKKRDGTLDEIGRTEVVLNSLSPSWITKLSIAYQFEIVQPLVFHVYDVDTKFHNVSVKALNLSEQDFLGEANCVLSEIVTKRDCTLTMKLGNKNGHGQQKYLGTLTVHAEEAVSSRTVVELEFNCKHLDNKDLLSKSDPFLRISRITEAGQALPICKTEVVKNNLNPRWKPVTLTIQQYGSKENPLIIECFDFSGNGNHELIGKLQKSVQNLESMYRDKTGTNFVKRRRNREKVLKGQLFVESYVEKQLYSFLDYISSGFEINFMVAVDFTASNGNPRSPTSLHYTDPSGRLNAYQQAIMNVGEVIQFYDSDRCFPTWGFGGSVNHSVSHCFNLNGDPHIAEVTGVEGIMAAYSSAIHTVALAGPTLFSQVIDRAADFAAQSRAHESSKYYVLLIITDGVLTDLQETKDALVRASDLPLSILIVGVGNADFAQMEILDADTGPRLVSSTGQVAS